jgi:hypothetical protein
VDALGLFNTVPHIGINMLKQGGGTSAQLG